ncbi:hypothetical protein GEMRC1_005778 [Eukaryota sp. GEM-RC1]
MPFKKSFVRRYIDAFRHCNTFTTSRAESAHHAIKTGDKFNKRDLEGIFNNINVTVMKQLSDFKRIVAEEKRSLHPDLHAPAVKNVFEPGVKKVAT